MLVKVCFKLNDERHVNQRVHLHHHHPIQILAKHPGNATLRIIIIMSSGGSSSNSRLLVATALGSACAGAALAVAVVKAWQRRDDANAAALQPHRPSVIMGYQSDSRNDMSGSGGTGGRKAHAAPTRGKDATARGSTGARRRGQFPTP
jgi:hypothetical protein